MQTPIETLIERLEAELASLDANNNFDSAKAEVLRFSITQAKELLEVDEKTCQCKKCNGTKADWSYKNSAWYCKNCNFRVSN